MPSLAINAVPDALLRALFGAADDLVVLTDTDGHVRYANASAPADRSITRDTLEGRLLLPSPALLAAQREVLVSGQSRHLEIPGRQEDSWLQLSVSAVRDDSGIIGVWVRRDYRHGGMSARVRVEGVRSQRSRTSHR